MPEISVNMLVAGAGFLAGLAFGATVWRTNFCAMGAISDALQFGDLRRLRAWVLAIAVAILGTGLLQASGSIDVGRSIYLTADFGWLGALLGGGIFGFGMMLAGGCGSRLLARLGAGSLKALVAVLVLGLFAGMTMRGLFAFARLRIEAGTNLDLAAQGLPGQGLPEVLGALLGLEPSLPRPLLAIVIGGGLAVWCLKDAAFRSRWRDPMAGLILGALVVAGWAITGMLGADDFEPAPLASFTFVGPLGDGLLYLMTFTGASISFGVAAVAGVIAGAGLAAAATGTLRLEGFTDTGDLVRHVVGGAMMGIGGVFALGCTVGQGLTGLSTLAVGSALAFAGILAGGVAGLRYLEEGTVLAALKAVFARG